MNIYIERPPSGGWIRAAGSKFHAHRMLICAALSDKQTYVECAERSDDIDATISCLTSLGARIDHNGEGFSVSPIVFPVPDVKISQTCGESGATLRFMLPVCCALGVSAEFITRGSHRSRTTSPLLEQLSINGCEIRMSGGALSCSGKLQSGSFVLQGNVSSEFISGLLLALPLLDGSSVINVEGRIESMSDVTFSLDCLRMFDVKVNKRGSRSDRGVIYLIEGGQKYISPGKATVEGDWYYAAVWLGAGAIGGKGITCSGLNLGSSQGEMAILRQVEKFGATVEYGGTEVTVSPAKTRGIVFDASSTPDLVPILALIASVSEGETYVNNTGGLRIQESGRLSAIAETLNALGADVRELQDGLMIRGKESLVGGRILSMDDCRIVMMASIASMVCTEHVTIMAAESLSNSYPSFFEDFKMLGGEFRIK